MAKNDSQKSPVVNSSLPDSVDGQLQSLYQHRGLNYISNDTNIIPRDSAGNIVLQENDVNNPLLIIDAVTEQFTNASVLKVLDTQFTYYNFPVSIKFDDASIDLDLNLQLQDPVFARYRPSEDRPILEGSEYSGILMDEVQDGLPQQSPNTYTISKEIKNSGVDLRFRIKLQHRFDSFPNPEAPFSLYGTAFFSIIKASEQGLNREYRTFENTTQVIPNLSNIPGSITRYSLAFEIQDLEVDIVIPNSEFEIGDRFGIGAKAGQQNVYEFHRIFALPSYWVISDASKNVDLWNQEILTTGSIND